MATVKFRRLSICEAEDAIAEIWNCLEEYGIPSPWMTFEFDEFDRGGEVSFKCRFDAPLWAHLVAMRLSTWLIARGRSAESGEDTESAGARYSLLSGSERQDARAGVAMASLGPAMGIRSR